MLAHYVEGGCAPVARRWRGRAGEIDLILRDGPTVIFVEVKQAATHGAAADRVSPRQGARILAAVAEFLAGEPAGQDTECRLDVALVDATGRVAILAGALAF